PRPPAPCPPRQSTVRQKRFRSTVPVAEPIRHAEALIQQALTLKRSDETRTVQQDTQPVKSVKTELKQALLSGISFAVPLIVAGGTVLAVAV
ncbi:hypothetical protein ACUODF_52740, partial [Escherichia coli]